jgi:hypothetical protein
LTEAPILKLLEEIDNEIKKKQELTLDRSLLLTALVFPLVDAYLKEMMKNQSKTPHLGEIEQIAFHVIDCIFNPFFIIPRKMKSMIALIIITQYRFIPLHQPQGTRKPRLPRDMITKLSLFFLKLRTKADSELIPQYTFWHGYLMEKGQLLPQ